MKITIATAILLTCAAKLLAQQPPDIKIIDAYWREGKYKQVITAVTNYYAGDKTRATLKLDIMRVASLCLTGGSTPDPKLCFEFLKKANRSSQQGKAIIEKVSANCDNLNVSELDQYLILSTSTDNQSPRTIGKWGYSTTESRDNDRGDSLKIFRHIPYEDLQKRRLKRNQGVDAGIFYKRLYDSLGLTNYKIKVLDKFIIVTTPASSAVIDYSMAEKKLDTYLAFYTQEYGMLAPDDYITFFLVKDVKEFRRISEKLHGFVLPSQNLGYSSLEDQCVVSIAVTPYKPLLGTACHELFHILSKWNYATLPPWLEEGMASLYEAAELKGNKVVGTNNWRINFLSGGHSRTIFDKEGINRNLTNAKVTEIIELDWDSFNQSDGYEANQSFNYAYSRYLMLYLQNKGNLQAFFKEASAYSYMDIKKGFSEDYFDLIKKYAPPSNDFDQAFKDWVKTMVKQAKNGIKQAKVRSVLAKN